MGSSPQISVLHWSHSTTEYNTVSPQWWNLVDTPDLGSGAQKWACGFKSRVGHCDERFSSLSRFGGMVDTLA